jgi:hypothetical protein
MDAIDDGSVPGLVPGVLVGITYSSMHPRAAQLDSARRTFARTNLVGMWTLGLLVVAIMGLLVLGAASVRKIRARATARRSTWPTAASRNDSSER